MLGLCSFAAVACFSLTVNNLIVNSVRLFSPRLFLLSCPCLFLGNPMLLLLRFNIRLCRRTPFDQRYKIDVVLANLSINGDRLNLFFMPVKRADLAFRTDSSSRKKKFIPRADEKASRKDTERERGREKRTNIVQGSRDSFSTNEIFLWFPEVKGEKRGSLHVEKAGKEKREEEVKADRRG